MLEYFHFDDVYSLNQQTVQTDDRQTDRQTDRQAGETYKV